MGMTKNAQVWIDRTRNGLAFFLIGSFVGAVISLSIRPIPSDNKDLLTYMIGQLSGMATMALGFYFTKGAGQDAQDAARVEYTGKLVDAVAASAPAAEPAEVMVVNPPEAPVPTTTTEEPKP